jgi:hypothetical protein
MEDKDFMASFEAGTLASENFHHRDHVRIVWLYLRSYPVLEALARFSSALKHFAAAHGKPQLYHETITWAYVFLINERRRRSAPEESWYDFAAANTDLLEWPNGILRLYYRADTLRSEFARKVFVLPDNDAGREHNLPVPGASDVPSVPERVLTSEFLNHRAADHSDPRAGHD